MLSADEESATAALVAVLLELDRHIAADGWDQPPRLFALVGTRELLAAEPQLAREASASEVDPYDLTAVEQHTFSPGADLLADLAEIEWPLTVSGAALSTVRSFLPAGREAELLDELDDVSAAEVVAAHPERQDVRVVVGVDRAGRSHGVARLASQPGELLSGPDLVPGLLSALAHTLN